jgi:hypothetical protein
VWNLRLSLGQMMQGTELRDIEWAPPKEAPSFLVTTKNPPEEYGSWQWAAALGRATGRLGADAFVMPRKRDAALPSGIKSLAGRSPSRKCVHAACHLPWPPNRLSALFSPGAVLGQRHQRRSPSECCSPFVTSSCLY